MFIVGRNRRMGRWSALLAAYAFVLNALLATTLLAATPASKSLSGFELCASSDAAITQLDHDDKATKRAAVHCQLCLQQAVPVALPPPALTALPLPVARSIVFALSRAEAPHRAGAYSPHAPRGPPHLG
jgi:hypothetical protein